MMSPALFEFVPFGRKPLHKGQAQPIADTLGWPVGASAQHNSNGDEGGPCWVVTVPSDVDRAQRHGAQSLYIPGPVSRQADLLDLCRASGLDILLERGAFLSPPEVGWALEKLGGATKVLLIEGGASFGVGQRVFDARLVSWLASQQLGLRWGLHLGLLWQADQFADEQPLWLSDHPQSWLEAHVREAHSLGASALVLCPMNFPHGTPQRVKKLWEKAHRGEEPSWLQD